MPLPNLQIFCLDIIIPINAARLVDSIGAFSTEYVFAFSKCVMQKRVDYDAQQSTRYNVRMLKIKTVLMLIEKFQVPILGAHDLFKLID